MLDLGNLRAAESGWRLNAVQRQAIYAGCLRGEKIGGFNWQIVWKPAAYLAAVAAAFFLILLLWPQRNDVEKIVVPGSPGARPAPFVENEPDLPEANGNEQPAVLPLVENKPSAEEELQQSPEDERTIVKFWETVPEMNLDEARKIIEKKLQTVKEKGSLGTLNDEERMALYVFGCQYVKNTAAFSPDARADSEDFEIQIILNNNLVEDQTAFMKEHEWTKQEELQNYAKYYEIDYKQEVFDGFEISNYYIGATYRCDLNKNYNDLQVKLDRESGKQVFIMFESTLAEKEDKGRMCNELYPKLLRYYLSLEEVVYLEGPLWHQFVSVDG